MSFVSFFTVIGIAATAVFAIDLALAINAEIKRRKRHARIVGAMVAKEAATSEQFGQDLSL